MLVGLAYSGLKRYRGYNNDVWQNRLPLTATTQVPFVNLDTVVFRKQARNLIPQLDIYSNLLLLISLSTPFNSFDFNFLYKSLPIQFKQNDYWQNVIKEEIPGLGSIIPYRRHRRSR